MSDQYSGIEKRKFKRVPASFIVFYRVNFPLDIRMIVRNREVQALAVDVSEGGLGAYTDFDIPGASIITENFILTNEGIFNSIERSRLISVQGEVRYNFFVEQKKSYRFGMQFRGLSAEDKRFVVGFVAANKAIAE